jgi:protein tyrosine/serine phosphatase
MDHSTGAGQGAGQERRADVVTLLKVILTSVISLGVINSYSIYCVALVWNGNFHVVEKGQIYRSAQLSGVELAREIDTYQIRSVLNLRGLSEQPWYKDELAVSREHGVVHYDVMMSARKPVPPEKIAAILVILRNAPKPILVHCEAGADRTGFVAALYRYAIRGQHAPEAEQELSLLYGHFPYLMSESGAMDDSARAYFLSHPAGDAFR